MVTIIEDLLGFGMHAVSLSPCAVVQNWVGACSKSLVGTGEIWHSGVHLLGGMHNVYLWHAQSKTSTKP
jgi:hypothetical protein